MDFLFCLARSVVFITLIPALLILDSAIAIAQVEEKAVCRVPSGMPSNLAIDTGRICLDSDPAAKPEGETVRLVGYGSISEVTQNSRWGGDADCNTDCNPD